MSKTPKIVQLNNDFIKEVNTKRRNEETDQHRRNRLIGWVLVVSMLFFILPTFNLVSNYIKLQEKKAKIATLTKEYQDLSNRAIEQKELAKNLKKTSYVEKYARAKYYYSKEGEYIYPLPDLVPK